MYLYMCALRAVSATAAGFRSLQNVNKCSIISVTKNCSPPDAVYLRRIAGVMAAQTFLTASFEFLTWTLSLLGYLLFDESKQCIVIGWHSDFGVATPEAPVNAAIHGRSTCLWTLRWGILLRWLCNEPVPSLAATTPDQAIQNPPTEVQTSSLTRWGKFLCLQAL